MPGWQNPRQPVPALGWWTNANGAWPRAPLDTFVGAGAEHRMLIVIPSLRLVAVRYGQRLGRFHFDGDYWESFERRLLDPILDAVGHP